MFSFFIFTGELQHLNGKCFNSEFVMDNHIILLVNAKVMRYICKKTCDVHETRNVRFFTFVFSIKFSQWYLWLLLRKIDVLRFLKKDNVGPCR